MILPAFLDTGVLYIYLEYCYTSIILSQYKVLKIIFHEGSNMEFECLLTFLLPSNLVVI